MKPWLIALVLLVAACKKSSTPPAVTNTGDPGQVSEPAVNECTTDDDCVVSCAREADCCDQLCGPCEQAFNVADMEGLEAWRAERCAATSCPVAKCMAPTEETFARCDAGTCVVERRPI